ncbi:MAG: T9SS type A sorting domain-containing protein [Bacteroidales bacterium]|nr:T9SS type A sorting domain-containing protein [Bacteroidales bacterium]MDD4742537.1 T9SS type A sorting domain-containing protein [Bacteroidales bacterium]
MKKLTLLLLMMATGLFLVAQNAALKPGLPYEQSKAFQSYDSQPLQHGVVGQTPITRPAMYYKSTDAVTIVNIGTSANAYGVANGGKSNLVVNNDINVISCIHRMGGALDPGGYSGDLGYDISLDGGMTWSTMNEIHTAKQNAGGQYFLDAARYPHNGIYNPAGNTDPNNAYIAYYAATLGATNGETWGGLCWGSGNIGDPVDTTYNFINTITATGIYHYVPQGFTVAKDGDFWGLDGNKNWTSGAQVYLGSLILSRGVWNTDIMDFDLEINLLEMTGPADAAPADYKVEFSPDGQIGYVMALMDIGEVPVSSGQSYYPVLFRTEDAGLTWSDAIPVALAGEDGIPGILSFLSDAEIGELYDPPLPDREQIPFTTSFDADITVDQYGNPHIAAIVGVTGSTAYSIVSARSAVSGYLFAGSFLISSDNMGEEGSWTARLMGRPSNFRGTFGELTEDNRIQVARNAGGTKMFVSWLDTDTTVSTENNAPDIHVRGLDIVNNLMTADALGNPLPVNVTYGSEATFSAFFFGMANEVFDDELGTYTIPFFYQEMQTDPGLPVQYKYIQDFMFTDADFIIVGIEDHLPVAKSSFEVSGCMPNPAAAEAGFTITLPQQASISMAIINITGQTVKSIPGRVMHAGSNSIALDVSDLNSGIYFFTVSDGANSITKKMVIK